MKRYAAIPLDFAHACGKIRANKDVDAAIDNQQLWLRFDHQQQELLKALRKVPYCSFYLLSDKKQLIEEGKRVPSQSLNIKHWAPLDEFFKLNPQISQKATFKPEPLSLSLIRSDSEQSINLMLCQFDAVYDYCQTASAIRLEQMRFACSKEKQVILWGQPQLPIKGQCYWENELVAIPAGYKLNYTLNTKTVREIYNAKGNELLLIRHQGHELIPLYCLNKLGRKAIRQLKTILGGPSDQ